jgi:SH3-like domain-containing protein
MTHAFRCSARRLSTFLALIVLTSIAPQAHAQRMVSVSGKEVNLRSGPGTQHPAEWTLSKGYPLTPHYIVKVKVANLRSQPTTRSRVVAKLAYGDVLRTLERKSDWVKVQRQGGLRGWVARTLLWGW